MIIVLFVLMTSICLFYYLYSSTKFFIRDKEKKKEDWKSSYLINPKSVSFSDIKQEKEILNKYDNWIKRNPEKYQQRLADKCKNGEKKNEDQCVETYDTNNGDIGMDFNTFFGNIF